MSGVPRKGRSALFLPIRELAPPATIPQVTGWGTLAGPSLSWSPRRSDGRDHSDTEEKGVPAAIHGQDRIVCHNELFELGEPIPMSVGHSNFKGLEWTLKRELVNFILAHHRTIAPPNF